MGAVTVRDRVKKRTRPAVTCTQVSAWARRRSVKAWPLHRALQCGIELAEALRYIHNEYPVRTSRGPELLLP